MKDNTIKNLPVSERPYERYNLQGVNSLSDAELLSIILRTGVSGTNITEIAAKVIRLCDLNGGIGYLSRISDSQLMQIDGIGKVKAAQIKCVAELCRRMWEQRRGKIKEYNSPNEIAAFYNQYIKGLDKEEVMLLLLDGRNHIICDIKLSLGSSNSSILSTREVFKEALRNNANGVVIIHNHPSGNSRPSIEDKLITSKVIKAGELIDIPLIDHIILGDNTYYSFKEAGYI